LSSKPNPSEEGSSRDYVSFDVPLTVYQAIDESMLDDTSTDYDVYYQLVKMAADAPADSDVRKVLFESAQIAFNGMNSLNDD